MNKKDVKNEKGSLENKAKIKIKDYFNEYRSLTKVDFSNFIKYIGLSEIWSTEDEQNLFWEKLVQNSENKNEIDYDTIVCGFNEFFEEEVSDDDHIDNIENNNISSNENDNDLLMDIDLQSLHIRSNSFEQEEDESYQQQIEEYINSIKDNQNIIYAIRFINEIFFSNNTQENVENKLDKNQNIKNFQIDKNEMINEIEYKYNFINLGNDFFNNYFNIISKQNDKTKSELLVEKSHLEYLNQIIKDIHNNKDKKSSIIKPLNINFMSIKTKNISNNINISHNLKKLKEYDSIINQCIGAIKNLNYKISYIDLVQEYIEKYIINLKNSIYEEIKLKDKEYEEKLLNLKSNTKIGDLNRIIKEEKIVKLQNEKLIKENNDISKEIELNQYKDGNVIQKGMKNNFSFNKNVYNQDTRNIPQKIKNKIIIPPLKLNKNNEEKSKISKEYNNSIDNDNIEEISTSNNNTKKFDNKAKENRINSINDVIFEDLTNSDINLFSINNNNIADQFLLDTTRLCNEEDGFNKNKEKKPNNDINEKDGLNYSNVNISNDFHSINAQEEGEEYFESELYDNMYFKSNFPLTDRNNRRFDNPFNYNLNIDNYHEKGTDFNKVFKSQTYLDMDVSKMLSKKKKLYTNEDIFYGYINKTKSYFYDFKYLSREYKIKKLLLINNEKLLTNQFFSDGIKACFISNKKKKYILIITFRSFYFLNNNETFECFKKFSADSLNSIIVSKKNFNLLLLSFKGGANVIIEIYQRMEMLRFLQNMLNKGIIKKDLIITASNYFFMTKKNGSQEKVPTIKNNLFLITPNFENAQKIGVLLKYKEGFFSSYFKEKLFVLCSIGLIYFDDDYKSPKTIIPIIGTIIKFIVLQLDKKIYCLKMKTINEQNIILGSYQKKEIFDWLKEFAYYKKIYQLKMKQINPNFVSDKSPKINNNFLIYIKNI